MGSVTITGADSTLGRRVAALAAEQPGQQVITLGGSDGWLDVTGDDLKQRFHGTDVLVHLAMSTPSEPTASTVDIEVARRVLDAASGAGVTHVIILSSATVYGAWANNPVPLTEAATLRPNPGVTYAAERAEIERLASEWRDAHAGATLTVLRPVRTVAGTERDWLVPALRPSPAVPDDTDEPPTQFLHLDDLAAAVDLARRERLDGAYNVAPDGSIPGDQLRSLVGAPPKVPLPERVAGRLVRWGWRWGLGPTHPELLPYVLQPWIVANDRLRAAGWSATVSNEEACIEAHDVGAWATLSPRRRQEIALGVAGAGVVAVVAGAVLAVRRLVRRR